MQQTGLLTIWGTGVYWTTNGGTNWTGFNNPPFGTNYGDPSSAIGTNGYFYEGYITKAGGMGVSTSTNNGATWTSSVVSSISSDDKNHLTVDKKVGSPYENRVYNTWTDFNVGANENQVVFKSSTDFGTTWGTLINLSASLPQVVMLKVVMFKPDQMVKFMLLLLFMMHGRVVKTQSVLLNLLMAERPGQKQEFIVQLILELEEI